MKSILSLILIFFTLTLNKIMKLNWFSNKNYQLATIYFLITFNIVVLYRFDPATTSGIYPPSLSRELGGFYCAGCGTLRALHQLLHGNIHTALRLNPLLLVVLPYLIYWFIAYNLQFFFSLKLPIIIWHKKEVCYLSTIVILYTLIRNIDLAIFSVLRP